MLSGIRLIDEECKSITCDECGDYIFDEEAYDLSSLVGSRYIICPRCMGEHRVSVEEVCE